MQTKKILTKLRLINWHYFSNETITFKNINLFSGENGAGKSTILDAIQLILTTNSGRFNLAANTDSKRNLTSYVRGKTGEEGNEFLRKGAVISYVALEFFEEAKQRYFVLGVKIDSPDQESKPKKKWFCEEGRLDQLSFITDNKPSMDDQFRNNGRKVTFTPQKTAAKDKFKHRLGHLQDTFFELLPKSLAFKPMKDVKSFVSQFILPENNVNIEALRENIRNLKEIQHVVEEVKRQVKALEDIQSTYDGMLHIDEQILVIDILIKIAEYESFTERIDEALRKIEFARQSIERNKKTADALEYAVSDLDEQYTNVRAALRSGETALLINSLKNEITGKKRDRDNLLSDVKKMKEQLKKTRSALRCVSVYSKVDVQELTAVENGVLDVGQSIRVISELKSSFDKASEKIIGELGKTKAELDAVKKELERLSREIRDLSERNKLTYDNNVTTLKEAIEHEFSVRGIASGVYILADLLEISDKEWQNAVEGYLNTQRFYIIVEPQYYDIAAEVYDRNRSKIHTAAVVNTAKLDINSEPEESSLASVVVSENIYARAFVRRLLGNVIMCGSVSALKEHSAAITKECMLYQGNALRKINPKIYKMPYIGKYAREQQLKLKEAEKLKAFDKKKELSEREEAYNTDRKNIERCNFEILKEVIGAPSDLMQTESELKELESKLKNAKNDPSYLELQMEAEKISEQLSQKREKLKSVNKDISHNEYEEKRYTEEVEKHRKEAAMVKARIDDMSTGREDALTQAQKRFDDHKKTKSADTIFANYQPRRKTLENQRQNAAMNLNRLQTMYKNGELGNGENMMPAYFKEYEALSKHDLISYEEKLRVITNNCETEFRESFLAKMRENIEKAISLFRELNKTLKPIYYGNDSYRFDWTPDKKKKRLYEMITSDFNLGGFNLFSTQFDEEYHDEMNELFSKLTVSEGNGDDVIREYTDYRSYLDYDIEIVSRDGKTQKFSKTYREKSGGETQTPYYVAIAASFVQLYSSGETIRGIMLDEAFDKMDEERIESMLKFFKTQDLQIILAAPTSRLELIGEQADNIIMIYTDSSHNSFAEEFSYDEI